MADGDAFRFFGRGLSAGTDYAIIASRFCGMGMFRMNGIEPCGGAFEHAAHACAQSAAGRVLTRPVASKHPSPLCAINGAEGFYAAFGAASGGVARH